jgi:pimeloyl-ACP methyl ester carboxylesterase
MDRIRRSDREGTMTQRRIRVRSGLEMEYIEQGDRSGVPVVMLHGFTDSWRSFQPVLQHLPPSIRAFSLTQRGHGETERPPSDYHPAFFVTDVIGFMDALEIERAVVVGHCMGGVIAERVAIAYPGRVLALAMLATPASIAANPLMQDFWSQVAQLGDPIDASFAREFQESTLAQPVPQARIDMMVDESLKVPARVWRAVLSGLFQIENAPYRRRLTVPTLLVWGDRDALVPGSDVDAIRGGIPHSELLVYAGGGHALHWETPARVARDLVGFIDRSIERRTAPLQAGRAFEQHRRVE